MDYTYGFVAMQMHDENVRRAEERIAIEQAAAERGAAQDDRGARHSWLRHPVTALRGSHRHAPQYAR